MRYRYARIISALNRNNENAMIGADTFSYISKIEPAGITPVSILGVPRTSSLQRKLLSSRHLRGNIRKENLRCAWEELRDKKKTKEKEEEQGAPK